MKLIEFWCNVVVQNKNPETKILRRFFSGRWLTFDELRRDEKFNYYVIKRLIDDLVKRGLLEEKSYSWRTGTNLHKKDGVPITKGKKWRLNKNNKIVRMLGSEI
jgi:hypothetical protein